MSLSFCCMSCKLKKKNKKFVGAARDSEECKKDNEQGLSIEKYRVLKPQKPNLVGYSFGDCVIIDTARSKVRMMVDGLLPKSSSLVGRKGVVVGTTAHYVDILLVKDKLCIRKKNTSVTSTKFLLWYGSIPNPSGENV